MNEKIEELKSQRVRSITDFTNELHDKVASLYENLMDNDNKSAKKDINYIIKTLRTLKLQ